MMGWDLNDLVLTSMLIFLIIMIDHLYVMNVNDPNGKNVKFYLLLYFYLKIA